MRGKKRDANHQEIAGGFEDVGALVLDLSDVGRGCPDLLIHWSRRSFFVEVKNPKTNYGKKGLNGYQKRLVDAGWPVFVVRHKEEITATLNEAMKLPESALPLTA